MNIHMYDVFTKVVRKVCIQREQSFGQDAGPTLFPSLVWHGSFVYDGRMANKRWHVYCASCQVPSALQDIDAALAPPKPLLRGARAPPPASTPLSLWEPLALLDLLLNLSLVFLNPSVSVRNYINTFYLTSLI